MPEYSTQDEYQQVQPTAYPQGCYPVGYPASVSPDPQYGQPQYPQPGYAYPQSPYPYGMQMPMYSNGVATASLVMGIVSMLVNALAVAAIIVSDGDESLSYICAFAAIISCLLGLVGIICGCIGISKAGQQMGYHRGFAIAGLITGALGFLFLPTILLLGR